MILNILQLNLIFIFKNTIINNWFFPHFQLLFKEENRRRYRQIIFSTPKKDLEPIAGVILQHETCYQLNDDGVPLIKLLQVR